MNIETHRIGTFENWKFGLITREVYRINANKFEINNFSDGWTAAIVTKTTLLKIYNGQKCLLSLNWE